MFGITITSTERFDALQTELKGFYQREEEVNEYLRLIQSQLKGLDMGKISGISRDQIKEAYETIAPVMGVINYIADNVGEISRYLELRDLKKGEYVEQHWILNLLNAPNDRYTRRKFFTAWAINRLLFGDAFVYAPKAVGANKGEVKHMYVLSGQNIIIEKGGLEAPFKGIRLKNGKNETIDLDGKVFQSFDYNLDDTSFFGTSKVAAAAVYLSIIDRAMNRQATSLKNGGAASLITPAGGGTSAPLPAQLDDLEQKINGRTNANRNVTTRLAVDVKTLGDTPVNLALLESHKDAINVLCFVFKLPVDIYLGQAKYENAKEAKKTIYEQIAIPMVNEFAEDFLHFLELDKEYSLQVNTDAIEVLRDSRTDTLATLEKMHASLNELREANGYDSIEEDWANQPILPMGIQFGNEAGAFDINE